MRSMGFRSATGILKIFGKLLSAASDRERRPSMFVVGLRYAGRPREPAGQATLCARAEHRFTSVDNLALRVPELREVV
jgi:hypothetical protein